MDQDETEPGKKITNLFNPVKTQEREYRNKRNTTTLMNASVDWEIIKNLNLRVMGGFSSDFSKNDQANLSGSKSAVLGTDGGIWGKITSGESRKWNNTNTLTYKLDIGDTHSMNLMVGNEQVSTTQKSVMATNSYFPDYGSVLENMALGTSPGIPESSQSTVRLMSFFARGFYSLMDKYLITATIRTDGSTKFHKDERWGVFPSVSAAWRLSEESFIKDVGFLNAVNLQTLKFRANYGESGNNRIDNDQYETVYTSGHYGIGNGQEIAMYPKSYANKNLKWETTVSRGVGLDWGIFKGRLAGTIDWYMNDTRDLLIKQRVSSIAGFSEQFQNIGSTRNTGMEFTLSIVPVAAKKKDDFQWNVDFNISFNKNKVKSLGGDMDEFYHTTSLISSEATDYIVRVGSPVGSMYGYVTDGYYEVGDFEFDAAAAQQKGNENNAWVLRDEGDAPNTELYNVVPGALKLKDLDGDGKVDANDRTVIGNANPTHFGGLNNTFSWKGFDLSVFINWVYGNDVYNVNKLRFTNSNNSDQNALSMMNESWRVFDNSGNDIRYDPSMLEEMNRGVKYWRPFDKLNVNHSWAIEDGSFLRINNITLGYTLPDGLTKRLRIQRLRFYVTLNNLYVFTKYTGYDPEVDTNSSPLAPNADYSAYPRSKGYIFGLNFTF
jgi:TonB-linked SusC/RagA family outer membrane protein